MTLQTFSDYMTSHVSLNRKVYEGCKNSEVRLFYGMLIERLEESVEYMGERLAKHPELEFDKFIKQAYLQLVADHKSDLFNRVIGIGDMTTNDLMVTEQIINYWSGYLVDHTDKQTFPLPHLVFKL